MTCPCTLGDAVARRRKKLPTTADEIRRAFSKFPGRSGQVERGERILEEAVYPGKKGRCVYFVTKTESGPFTSTKLCVGGRSLTQQGRFTKVTDAMHHAQIRASQETDKNAYAREQMNTLSRRKLKKR